MCGRYALALRPSEVRRQLEQSHMPVDEAPDDDGVRQSYNFAPGYHGLVYRADGPENTRQGDSPGNETNAATEHKGTKYKLQAMKWGLIPFWTKRNPDYASVMKTINCRDDSLLEDRGMWTSMKRKKRCIVVAQGFYEWLKKDNGKQRIPHFTKRKDGQLMCLAGLWDCVEYEDGAAEKTYTYTIITTDSNKQLSFLHDRMPVILDNGSDAIRTWLDPARTEWSADLQALLKPYDGELECYPVSGAVGKVGNNSPSFIIPVDSAENKSNIANFFGKQAKKAEKAPQDSKVEHDADENRATTRQLQGTEDNAPLPIPATEPSAVVDVAGVKRAHSDDGGTADGAPQKRRAGVPKQSPAKKTAARKTHSATSNAKSSPAKKGDGSQKITSFFAK